jgi:hypothetical protein
MDAPQIIANALTLNANFIDKVLSELSDADLMTCPNDHSNPIGWTLWHQFRVEDNIISTITGSPHTWIEGGWHSKFGLEADSTQVGGGDTMEQVKALQVTGDNLKGYAAAVRDKTLSCLQSLSPADLDREFPGPGGGTRKAGDMLGILMIDHFHHSGQVCYISGYLKGAGWLGR